MTGTAARHESCSHCSSNWLATVALPGRTAAKTERAHIPPPGRQRHIARSSTQAPFPKRRPVNAAVQSSRRAQGGDPRQSKRGSCYTRTARSHGEQLQGARPPRPGTAPRRAVRRRCWLSSASHLSLCSARLAGTEQHRADQGRTAVCFAHNPVCSRSGARSAA